MGDNGEINAISAAARIGGALELASFESPLTINDLAKVVLEIHDYEWKHMHPSVKAYWQKRVRSILPSIVTVNWKPIAEDKRDGRLVYFLLEPP